MKLAKSLIAVCESINEMSDIEKAREQVSGINDKLTTVKLKIKKEKELGKSDNVLNNLKKEWQHLQNQVVKVWQDYDKKHGTSYAKSY